MSTEIKKLNDKNGNYILPETVTKAIYDEKGNRLDNILNGFRFATQDGKDGYIKEVEGADTFFPFISGEVKELLWNNPNPTSNFNAQTIPLDLSNYKQVIVEFARFPSSLNDIDTVVLVDVNGSSLACGHMGASFNKGASRKITVTTSGVTISDSYENTSIYNNNGIPLHIYGIKDGIPSANPLVNLLTPNNLTSSSDLSNVIIDTANTRNTQYAYLSFDGDLTSYNGNYDLRSGTTQWYIGYKFDRPVCISYAIEYSNCGFDREANYTLQYSDDGTNWFSTVPSKPSWNLKWKAKTVINGNHTDKHLYWRIFVDSSQPLSYSGQSGYYCCEVQMYGN